VGIHKGLQQLLHILKHLGLLAFLLVQLVAAEPAKGRVRKTITWATPFLS
jgi:hypothetical protein